MLIKFRNPHSSPPSALGQIWTLGLHFPDVLTPLNEIQIKFSMTKKSSEVPVFRQFKSMKIHKNSGAAPLVHLGGREGAYSAHINPPADRLASYARSSLALFVF